MGNRQAVIAACVVLIDTVLGEHDYQTVPCPTDENITEILHDGVIRVSVKEETPSEPSEETSYEVIRHYADREETIIYAETPEDAAYHAALTLARVLLDEVRGTL